MFLIGQIKREKNMDSEWHMKRKSVWFENQIFYQDEVAQKINWRIFESKKIWNEMQMWYFRADFLREVSYYAARLGMVRYIFFKAFDYVIL